MSIVLVALAASVASYDVRVDHDGRPVEAVYTARTAVKTRTIGAHTPNRMDGQRCRWTAQLIVERRVAGATTRVAPPAGDQKFSGSRAGACTPDTAWIDREVASRDGAIRTRLAQVAAGDRATLLADLDAMRALASN